MPRLFKPFKIHALDTYQDGALRHNNPINIALWESKFIWPSIVRPDVVVSLGTGTRDMSQSPYMTSPKSFWKATSIPRLWESFKCLIDGQIIWLDLLNRLTDRERQNYFRPNVTFRDAEPAIDDVASMDLLAVAVRSKPQGPRERIAVITALLISNFYFELDGLPEHRDGMFQCFGAIRCRLDAQAVIRKLYQIHPEGLEFINNLDSTRHTLGQHDICPACQSYRRPVTVCVRSLTDDIAFALRSKSSPMLRHISSMPQSIAWFVDMQALSRPFGSANHGDAFRARCRHCSVERVFELDHKRKRTDETAITLHEHSAKRTRLLSEVVSINSKAIDTYGDVQSNLSETNTVVKRVKSPSERNQKQSRKPALYHQQSVLAVCQAP